MIDYIMFYSGMERDGEYSHVTYFGNMMIGIEYN